MKKTLVAIAAGTLLASPLATAQTNPPEGLHYTYLEANLAVYPDVGGQDFIGPRVRGSFLVIPEVFLFGQYRFLTDDEDYTQAHLGAAYRYEVLEGMDLYAGPSLEYIDADIPGVGSTDDFGFGIRLGMRHRANEDWEFAVEGRYVNVGGDINDFFGLTGTVQYFLNEQLGLIGEVDGEDGEVGFLGGARFNF